MRDWVDCPNCGEPDMREENGIIHCTNEQCRSIQHQYVAARLWKPEEPVTFKNLCIYTYGKDILTGTLEDARSFCEYAARMSKDKDAKTNPYKPYKITFEEWK